MTSVATVSKTLARRPDAVTDHAVDRYIERWHPRDGCPDRWSTARQRLKTALQSATQVGDELDNGKSLWRLEEGCLLVVNARGAVLTVLPKKPIWLDVEALRAEFFVAKQTALYRARWADGPVAPSDVCCYCGRYWQQRVGSRLDGHAACIVPDDFKRRIGELLRSPLVTYAVVAEVLGVTPGIVRSWAFSAGVVGPTTHKLRLKGHP
jgi:hypothetical protein